MNDPELVSYICPDCHKIVLKTLTSAKVTCGPCHQSAYISELNLPPGTTCKEGGIEQDGKSTGPWRKSESQT